LRPCGGELPLGIGRDRLVTVGDQDGSDFQAGTPITASRALRCNGCWTANMTLALTGSTSAAKWSTKSSPGSQAKLYWSIRPEVPVERPGSDTRLSGDPLDGDLVEAVLPEKLESDAVHCRA
jgi:hypothetical protein